VDSPDPVVAGDRPALLQVPADGAAPRAGVVALHGASLPQRRQPLFDHLAATLGPLGVAVLSYDRRPAADGDGDTSLSVQADDALAAASYLRERLGVPVGLYGFSQGAWAATLAASLDLDLPFLAVLGCSGVSPAEQMRFYTDELLRRAGHGPDERSRLRRLRLEVEELLRGRGDRATASALLAAAREEPWYGLAYLPDELPGPEDSWADMDHDPVPVLERVTCPTLALYGADEECVPGPASIAAWRRAAEVSGNAAVTLAELPGCGHFPAPGVDGSSLDVPRAAFSPAYAASLTGWFAAMLDR
jgi:hypothetical protein